ncbi:hypothetical protein [Actinophytocola sp.]|uniref:3-hydroxyacyl-ACP dehydratase FabZ family protein n=1 Tax=Actinophytocola sp. TaxID=1872138 RepID=UPI002D7F1634|nr:hypothetical protein [Actinophytocola sp.]HET9140287.1 hypothetical protein [Actinophytocola sp.]
MTSGPWVLAVEGWPVVRTGGTVSAVLPVRPDEPVFAGHYPDFPVLPGVCVIECVHRTALADRPDGTLASVELARFLGPVRPGDELSIELTWSDTPAGWRCSAEVATGRARVAQVRLGYRTQPPELPASPPVPQAGHALGLDRISALLPHRYPMLLLDRVRDLVPGATLTAVKAVSGNEPWHRDGGYPAVLVIESWCQAAGVLAPPGDQVLLLGSMTGVDLGGPVLPGDVLEHRVRLGTVVGDTAMFTGDSTVDGRTVLSVRRLMVTTRPASELRVTEGERAR